MVKNVDNAYALEVSVKDLFKHFDEEPNCLHVRQCAYEVYRNEELLQVQVIITRNEADFLHGLTTEIMSRHEQLDTPSV